MYKLSVIIPVYNVENYLRECLDSITNQTVKDIEIICVDDGSSDNSPEILKEYQKKIPESKSSPKKMAARQVQETLESRKPKENTLHLSTQTISLKLKCLKSSTQKQRMTTLTLQCARLQPTTTKRAK